jgi:hypothetical protein
MACHEEVPFSREIKMLFMAEDVEHFSVSLLSCPAITEVHTLL